MAKMLIPDELAEIVSRALRSESAYEEHSLLNAYPDFIGEIANVVCQHFGGAVGTVSGPNFDRKELEAEGHDVDETYKDACEWMVAILHPKERANSAPMPEDKIDIWTASGFDPEGWD